MNGRAYRDAMKYLRKSNIYYGMCNAVADAIYSGTALMQSEEDHFRALDRVDRAEEILAQYFKPQHTRQAHWGILWSDRKIRSSSINDAATCEEIYNCRLLALGFAAAIADSQK